MARLCQLLNARSTKSVEWQSKKMINGAGPIEIQIFNSLVVSSDPWYAITRCACSVLSFLFGFSHIVTLCARPAMNK